MNGQVLPEVRVVRYGQLAGHSAEDWRRVGNLPTPSPVAGEVLVPVDVADAVVMCSREVGLLRAAALHGAVQVNDVARRKKRRCEVRLVRPPEDGIAVAQDSLEIPRPPPTGGEARADDLEVHREGAFGVEHLHFDERQEDVVADRAAVLAPDAIAIWMLVALERDERLQAAV